MRAQPTAPGDEKWLRQRTGVALTPDCRGVMAIDRGLIRGMVIFDLWTPGAAQVHIALERAAALRCLLPAAADFVFDYAKKRKLIGLVPSFNGKSLRLARHLGFTEAHRIHDGWSAGVDLVIFELTREACRWWKGAPDVQQRTAA